MNEELLRQLAEEARILQESTIPPEEIEDESDIETEDIEYEEVKEDLYKVYNIDGEIIEVLAWELENQYVDCEDGTRVNQDKVLDIDNYYYNPFTETVLYDKYNNPYIEDYSRTYQELLVFKEDGSYDPLATIRISIHTTYEDEIILGPGVWIHTSDLTKYGYEIVNHTLKKVRSIEDFKKELFTDIPYFEECITSIYGDNWDISYHQQFNSFCVIIKFDEFVITNSKRQTHIIKELYVLMPLLKIGDKLNFSGTIYGGRGLMSNVEMTMDRPYQHSHLGGGVWDKITHFCLGTGPINGYILDFNRTPNENNLFSVLYNIRIYVEWESIEGTPYKYIANLGKGKIESTEVISISTDRVFKEYVENYKIPLKIFNSNGINQIKIDENIVETELITLKYFNNDDYGYKVYKNRTTGNYYRKAILNYKDQKSSNILLTYKGENIYAKTYSIETIKIEDTDYVIHPSIKKQFVENAIRRIRNYYFKEVSGINSGKSFYHNI